jgi:ribosomal-protein-alanine N-acetyltransferase
MLKGIYYKYMSTLILTTERTYLREFNNLDTEALTLLLADPKVMHFSMSGIMTREESQKRLESHIENYKIGIHSPWAIIHQDNLIGFAGFDLHIVENEEKVQIAFRLMRDQWGKGLATEVSKALIKYAFDTLKLKEIIAIVDPKNISSINTLRKIGMAYQKTVNYQGLELDVYNILQV